MKRTALKTIRNERKQDISSNNAAGPQLPTNAVTVTQPIFSSSSLLGTMQLMLTSSFHVLKAYKAAFAFEQVVEAEIRIRRMRILMSFVTSLLLISTVQC